MACIKSAPRSALVAFAPEAPYLVAGTMAGAVDLSFSSSACLEIYELDFRSDASELPLAGACSSTERFNRLSWSKPVAGSEEYSMGLVAGGLGEGSIGIWNPCKLISSEDQNNSFVAPLEKHKGPVRGLEFSALQPNLLASGADEGALYIWDMAKPSEPNHFPPLKSAGSDVQTEISFVSWNAKYQHILASTSYNGMTVVWDLRQQKPVTSFSDGRRCSVLQWSPDISTDLIIASDDDSSPSLRVWDVRKSISPAREIVGHTKGVIAMSWCPYDSSRLLTCAKDNRTICWDTSNGEIVSELPASTNWNFDVHWYPKIPGVISASSFDVKIGIYNIQACNRLAMAEGEFSHPARVKAPTWLKRRVGCSFGFGGKLVTFQPNSSVPSATCNSSEVYVHSLVTEHSLVDRSTEFGTAIQGAEKLSLRLLCEKKSQDSLSEDEKETWGFLKVMFKKEGTARTNLLTHLGFSVPNEESENAMDEVGKKLANGMSLDENANPHFQGGSPSMVDNGEDYFNNLKPYDDNFIAEKDEVPSDKQIDEEPEDCKSTVPLIDSNIQRALVVGDYKGAVLQCIDANKMADALVIAHFGGSSLWESTRNQYLRSSLSPYLKIVSAIGTNDLLCLVNSRPLDSWKETLALLCTFAQKDEWTVLCDTLALRLITAGNTLAATLCYICAGNIDKTVEIWSCSLKSEHDGKTYVDLLQDLMEKTIILALATGQKHFSAALSKLVKNYAELLAGQGLFTTAMEYLKFLGSEESSHELAILQDRIMVSAAEREVPSQPQTLVYDTQTVTYDTDQQADSMYPERSNYGVVGSSQQYYQDKVQHDSIHGGPYGDGYSQPITSFQGYQQIQQPMDQQIYTSTSLFQPAQSMFIPSPAHHLQGNSPPSTQVQPTMRPFVPAPAPPIKNVDQFQQPSLGSHLYPGMDNHVHQPSPPVSVPSQKFSQSGPFPSHNFRQVMAPEPAPRGFTPMTTNPGYVPRPGFSPAQPSSPTWPPQVQSVVSPPAPPPTVQTVDTSNVPAELRPVITTLTRLYHESSEALGGSHANASKKREIEDNSRKFGALFAKLNSGDISPNAVTKLSQLCQALDSGDFAGALQIQVHLTTSDWDECNFWLAALKRMMKTRQSVRMN